MWTRLRGVKIGGLGPLVFEGLGFEEKISTLNISKTRWGIFAKFSGIAGLEGPSLRFGREVGGGSNFRVTGGRTCQKWQCDLEVGHFERVPDIL